MIENRLASWATGLATFVALVDMFSASIFYIAFFHGGAEATMENWVGTQAVICLLGGFALSSIAFGMAIAAKIEANAWRALWLPISLFPMTLIFIVVGQLSWWS